MAKHKYSQKKAFRKSRSNSQEDRMLETLDRVRLMEEYLPAVEEYVKKGGTVEGFLKNSTPMAFATLSNLLFSENETVSYKAAVELLNRAMGKSVERKQVLFSEIDNYNERQLDAEILKALKKDPSLSKAAAKSLLAAPETAEQPKTPAPKKERRPEIITELVDE